MLYRFKSRAAPDFVMLEVHARQLLDIVGKPAAPQGIITVEQIPSAIAALEAALARESTKPAVHNHDEHAVEGHDADAEKQHVGLHPPKDGVEDNHQNEEADRAVDPEAMRIRHGITVRQTGTDCTMPACGWDYRPIAVRPNDCSSRHRGLRSLEEPRR